MAYCPKQTELAQHASEILEHIVRTTHDQIEALKKNDQTELMKLDKQLELLFGEKERAFGSLGQHKKDHGC